MQINYNDAAAAFLAHTKVFWSRYQLKKLKIVALGYLTGIALFWFGASTDTMTSSHTDKHGTIYTTVDFHITESLSILVLAFTTYSLIRLFRSRIRSFSEVSAISARWRARYANEMSITIDASGISYVSPELSSEIRWPLVNGYSRYKGHIFIYTSGRMESSIIIDTRLLSAQENEELSGLLHRNDVPEI